MTNFSYTRRIEQVMAAMLTFLFLSSIVSCKKDQQDESAPVISISSPNLGTSYYFHDAIQVIAKVTDDQNIESIHIEITDQTNQRFLQDITYRNEGTSKDISTSLYHEDLYLTSGTYYVKITASDGANESVDFKEIQLFEAPKLLSRILLVRQTTTAYFTVDSLSADGLTTSLAFISGLYTQGGFDTKNSLFYYSNEYLMQMIGYPVAIGGVGVQPPSASFDYFRSSFYDEKHHDFYIGSSDGSIWRMGENDQIVAVFQPFDGMAVNSILVGENYIFTYTKNSTGTSRNINAYHRTTGTLLHSTPVDFDVVGMVFNEDEDQVLLAGNIGTTAHLRFYNNETNAINVVFNNYPTSTVLGIWRADESNIYISHATGIAYYSNYLDSYSVNSLLNPSKIYYEPTSGRSFLVTPDGLSIMDKELLTELNNYPFFDLKDLWFAYNK